MSRDRRSANGLDLIFGETPNQLVVQSLYRALQDAKVTGTLYIGYPVLTTADTKIFFDALLVSTDVGLIAFDTSSTLNLIGGIIENTEEIRDRQDQIYIGIRNKLSSFRELRKGRSLALDIRVITFHPDSPFLVLEDNLVICAPSHLHDVLKEQDALSEGILRPLNAAIQHVATLRPAKKREQVTRLDSRGAKLKTIEREIANLDQWQKQGAIETVDAPQRIRGLAGSGKTIVLALKAACLHARHPEWTIVVTFNTRSLYQHFQELIRRFTYDQISDEPDWSRLLIMHAWGGTDRDGVYSLACQDASVPTYDFGTASQKFTYRRAFDGACSELLAHLKGKPANERYDAVLIDEAQDLPASFFRLVYAVTKQPKRIIWAYDDLQNLGDYVMPSAEELFGEDNHGNPLVTLRPDAPGQPRQDIVLPVCYRNTPWALSTAHALGFGIYRPDGLVQMFEAPGL